jgi:hypothetical protein
MGRIKFEKCPLVFFALPQNCIPTQPSLRTLQRQHLKKQPVVINGNAPFSVMIGSKQILSWPIAKAPFFSILCPQLPCPPPTPLTRHII